jgi:hypothetical protein
MSLKFTPGYFTSNAAIFASTVFRRRFLFFIARSLIVPKPTLRPVSSPARRATSKRLPEMELSASAMNLVDLPSVQAVEHLLPFGIGFAPEVVFHRYHAADIVLIEQRAIILRQLELIDLRKGGISVLYPKFSDGEGRVYAFRVEYPHNAAFDF